MLHNVEQFDASRCHGCGLCAMVCPVYHQGGGIMDTPHGWAKALQSHSELDREKVFSCMLCGACAPLCPQDIDMMQMLVGIRTLFSDLERLDRLRSASSSQRGKVVLIADRHLMQHEAGKDKVLQLLGHQQVVMADDQGQDISDAMCQGREVSHARLHQFLSGLQSVKKIVISDGLLQKLIKDKLPQISMQSLGKVLSSHTTIRNRIGEDDFYVMDSQSYHADFDDAVIYYDQMQQQTSCVLNRDLHRLAIATGAQSRNGFDHKSQYQWLMAGRKVSRVIAESFADYQLLSQHCDLPVVHISELM